MGMSGNGIYPPAKNFHWEDDENIIEIPDFQTNDAFQESREHFGAAWGPPYSKFETGSQTV